MDAGLIFALIWSVLALGWGGFLIVKRDELARGSKEQQERNARQSKGMGTTRRWSLSARAVGWVGGAFVLVGLLTLGFGILGATR